MRLIDADVLYDAMLETGWWNNDDRDEIALPMIENAPTITADRPKGEWVAVRSFEAFGGYYEAWMAHGDPIAFHYCSNCREQAYLDEDGKEILSNFCPFCGADMRAKESE